MKLQTIAYIVSALPILASPTPLPFDWPSKSGQYVRFADLESCPIIALRPHGPASASDVRPDEISVVMALGDSITAGFLARTSPQDVSPASDYRDYSKERPISAQSQHLALGTIPREYRGLSYPIGGDPGAITLPNILSHWSNNLTGMSTGYHPLLACIGGWCPFREREDGLNAAVSGSTSSSLVAQVMDSLLPRLKAMKVDDKAWKFVNIGIGANDICAFCLTPNITSIPLAGTPQEFARGIQDAVELLRKYTPNLIVNIFGVLRVSAVYDLTLKDPYCRGPFLPQVPHLPLECSCAFLPGPGGDYTRRRMDELGEAYDTAVLGLIRDWEAENDPTFGVTWQPGSAIDLEHWPIEALSPIDCFHPSELAHQRVAAGLWNRLTFDMERKAVPIRWDDEVYVRCLEEDDRIIVGLGGR